MACYPPLSVHPPPPSLPLSITLCLPPLSLLLPPFSISIILTATPNKEVNRHEFFLKSVNISILISAPRVAAVLCDSLPKKRRKRREKRDDFNTCPGQISALAAEGMINSYNNLLLWSHEITSILVQDKFRRL